MAEGRHIPIPAHMTPFAKGKDIRLGRHLPAEKTRDKPSDLRLDVQQAMSARDRIEKTFLVELGIKLQMDITGWESKSVQDVRSVVLDQVGKLETPPVYVEDTPSISIPTTITEDEPSKEESPEPHLRAKKRKKGTPQGKGRMRRRATDTNL